MKKQILSAAFLILTGCQSSSGLLEKNIRSQLVPRVDIPRFMGDWFVIATIPTPFEKGAHNAIERYEWNKKEERVDVSFFYNKDSFTGDVELITQKGWVQNKGEGAYWKVQPFWPLKFDYLVIGLDPQYRWSIVGVPDRSYVWIMARTPQMSEEDYQVATQKIEKLGYDLTKLIKVPHNGQKPKLRD